MNSEIILSRPYYDTRAAAQGVQEKISPLESNNLQLSSDLATVGYQIILEQAGTNCHKSQNIQQESRTLCQETTADAFKTQAERTRLLGERLQEIHYWKSELQRHIENLQANTDSLLILKRRLERALDATEVPYAIVTDNLTCRARRLGAALVRDTVEDELLKEVELIKSIQALLKKTAAQVVAQIKRNRSAQQTLEMDWSDKYQAYNFDDTSGRHSNMSPDTQNHQSSATMQKQVSNPSSWTKFTQDNLSQALQEEQATNSLRMLVEQMLQDTTEDLSVQCSNVDRAFSLHCDELIEAKTQLEMKLTQILAQIGGQERNIEALQQAIHNKEAPLRVVQSRLYLRSLRPAMELCRDQAQLSLEGEVRLIDATLESLKKKLSEARGSLSHLEESRMALQKDINCKINLLFIDREKCMTHRKRYPSISALSGY
ncbi:tektin-4 [Cyprinodon tularosa]|uniref:tektin-4 n=1 Tax=Cyprinodon tularosa TaxID=77115 RepID=UPI0018E269E5|nr:tektin-4 [Cyprinodon tularosa]